MSQPDPVAGTIRYMNTHRQLATWRAASDLVVVAYRITAALPTDEKYVAAPQLRRAAWSVPNNIAEGNAKKGRGERRRFYDTALGSLAEVDSIVGTLTRIYQLNPDLVRDIERLRRIITAGLFAMLRNGRR
jgi:four helix bundle protein